MSINPSYIYTYVCRESRSLPFFFLEAGVVAVVSRWNSWLFLHAPFCMLINKTTDKKREDIILGLLFFRRVQSEWPTHITLSYQQQPVLFFLTDFGDIFKRTQPTSRKYTERKIYFHVSFLSFFLSFFIFKKLSKSVRLIIHFLSYF